MSSLPRQRERFKPHSAASFSQVAELYEELKGRISQFNMYVDSRRPAVDQEHAYKQRFILQVCGAGRLFPVPWLGSRRLLSEAGRASGTVAGPPCPRRARGQGELLPAQPRVSCPDGWVIQTCHRCPEGVCVARPPRPPSDGSFVSAFRGGKRPQRCLGSSAVPSRCKRRNSGGCGQPSLSGGTSGAVSRDASSRKVAEALR